MEPAFIALLVAGSLASSEPPSEPETTGWEGWPHQAGIHAVDESGVRVAATSGGGWSGSAVAVHTWRGGKWSHETRDTVPVSRLAFVKDGLEVNFGATPVEIAEVDRLREGLLLDIPAPPARCGDLLVVPTMPVSLAAVLRRRPEGWAEDGALRIEHPTDVTVVKGVFACAGDRIVAFVSPANARCAVLEFEQRDGAWSHEPPWFPGLCPEPADVGDISLDYDGNRLLLGAYPSTGDAPGAAVLYVRKGDGWVDEARFEPDLEASKESDAGRPGQRAWFGGRVALGADRAYVSAGRKQVLESRPGYESATGSYDSVYVFARSGSSWESEEVLQHESAASGFGESITVRGERLFVGDGDGLHAFEMRDGSWTRFGYVVGDKVTP